MPNALRRTLSDFTGDEAAIVAITSPLEMRSELPLDPLPGHILKNVEFHRQRQRESNNHGPGVQ
jgi:hypothetical protein